MKPSRQLAADPHPFRIDPNVWRQTIMKALNFFYAERCNTV